MTRLRPGLTFSHLGIFATDIEKQASFYKTWLDFTETDRGTLPGPQGLIQLIFLSRDPDEHHQIVFVSGRPPHGADAFNTINQISLKADSLQTLQSFHQRLQQAPVTELQSVTHGNALSIYFRDPESNRVELYVDTSWYVDQPCRIAAPFELPTPQLLAWAEDHARTLPGFRPRSQWRAEMARRMGIADDTSMKELAS